MQKAIIIENNLCLALNQILQDADIKVIYRPFLKSIPQKNFHNNRLKELSKKFKHIATEQSSNDHIITVYAWDSFDEKRKYGNQLNPLQNRLFKEIPFEIPSTFSSFKNKVIKLLPRFYSDAIAPIDNEVLNHIENYFSKPDSVLNYFETRNQLSGDHFATGMSPYLSSGHLDVKYLYNRVKFFEKENTRNKSTEWIVYELLWREFFYWHYQKVGNLFFSRNGIKGEKDFTPFTSYKISELFKLEAHPFFHAALNELRQTGFLSNRARQMFASIWINDLQLDWRAGATLFEEYLIDYDVYTNWGNWMYLAGVGVDPRGKRYFDIDKQLKNYDHDQSYLSKWN